MPITIFLIFKGDNKTCAAFKKEAKKLFRGSTHYVKAMSAALMWKINNADENSVYQTLLPLMSNYTAEKGKGLGFFFVVIHKGYVSGDYAPKIRYSVFSGGKLEKEEYITFNASGLYNTSDSGYDKKCDDESEWAEAKYKTLAKEIMDNYFKNDLTPIFCAWLRDCDNIDCRISAARIDGVSLAAVPEKHRTKRLCRKAVEKSGNALEFVPEKYKTPKLCLAAAKYDGSALRFTSDKTLKFLLRTKKGCITLLKCPHSREKDYVSRGEPSPPCGSVECTRICQNIPAGFWSDKDFCVEAAIADTSVLPYINDKQIKEKACIAAIQNNPENLEHIPEEMKTEMICHHCVTKQGSLLYFVPEKLKTEKLCLAAVKQNSCAISHVPESLKTAELCLAAVEKDGRVLSYIPEPRKTYELCLTAVKNNGIALKYVPEPLKTFELCLAAVKKGDDFDDPIQYVPEHLKARIEAEMKTQGAAMKKAKILCALMAVSFLAVAEAAPKPQDNGIPQHTGIPFEMKTYPYTAPPFDTSLVDAAIRSSAKLASTPDNITPEERELLATGRIDQPSTSSGVDYARAEIDARKAWVSATEAAAAFYQKYPPFEIVFDTELGTRNTNYEKETMDLYLRSLVVGTSGWTVLNTMNEELKKTTSGKRWGIKGWPIDMVFGKMTTTWAVGLFLFNANGKRIGTAQDTLTSDTGIKYYFTYYGAYDLKKEYFGGAEITFKGVKIADITDKLTVSIALVNGLKPEKAVEQEHIGLTSRYFIKHALGNSTIEW